MQPATKARPVNHPIARRYRLAALLAAVLVVSIACGSGGSSGSTQTDDLDPAPDFTTVLYSGGTGEFTLSEQLGHPVLINIWGSWCPPCRAEFPALQQAWDKYKDQGLVLFGVNAGAFIKDSEEEAKEFLEEQGTTFMTGPDIDDQIILDYRVLGFPATYFITPGGKIYETWTGQIDDKNLNRLIEELLAL
ncbi:MAG: TlpA disulfide reductase family protein [Chloroflexi bacterium]|nr:TlpA disulfide reductase family protein [Chloroflexota bacterium]